MVTTYGSFPGVRVEVAGGGITSIAIGEEEKLVLFGAADYQNEGDFTGGDGSEDPLVATLDGSPNTPAQINARREADSFFGDGSELADGMREALANGGNIDFLYGVAPKRFNVVDEVQSTQSGTLSNAPLVEEDVQDESNIQNIVVDDTTDGTVTVEYDYASPPSQPSSGETVAINPLTGEYAADAAPTGDYNFDYKYLDWESAFTASDVKTIVDEDETGIYVALNDSDAVASALDTEVSSLRDDFQLVNGISGAEPNDNEVITSDDLSLESDHSNYTGRDARFDTSAFSAGSVDSDHYFELAPVRVEDSPKTILGGVGGLFAGNPISDPIYNDAISGYDSLEQTLTKTDADNLRDENVIPVRQAGSIRVKGNLSTSSETDWERDFWRRRIADRVIIIAKEVGDNIIGQINDERTRSSAEELITLELQQLIDDRLLEASTGEETKNFVDVYESSTDPDEVKIDIGFTPLGIVKRVDETITINT